MGRASCRRTPLCDCARAGPRNQDLLQLRRTCEAAEPADITVVEVGSTGPGLCWAGEGPQVNTQLGAHGV